MKRLFSPICLLSLAIVAAWVSRFLGVVGILINGLPAAVWSLLLLLGRRRWPAMQDRKSALMGLLYGLLAGVAAAAFAVWFSANVFADDTARYPYDSAAGAILMALFAILLLGTVIFDLCKNGMKPLWLRLVTALTCFLPTTLLAFLLMDYFEGVLSRYVS